MSEFNIPENVDQFLSKAASEHGRFQAEQFDSFMRMMCANISSPIEQLFFIGLHLVADFNFVDLSVLEKGPFRDGLDDLLIIPQWEAGKFKVDFALRQHPVDRIVCVELDGHEFHDRDERQRRYEKARDRFLTAQGYSVLHFTGAEVVKDPCAVALEAFNLATGLSHVATNPFDTA